MANHWDGIGEAESFERGKYVPGDFVGVLEIKKTIMKETIKSGIGFIVEMQVIETNMPDAMPEGSACTWFQKMSDKTVAFPAIKSWAAAVAGYHSHDKAAIEAELAPELSNVMLMATDNPADNDFVGQTVRLETHMIKTRNGRDFTVHTWGPHIA